MSENIRSIIERYESQNDSILTVLAVLYNLGVSFSDRETLARLLVNDQTRYYRQGFDNGVDCQREINARA